VSPYAQKILFDWDYRESLFLRDKDGQSEVPGQEVIGQPDSLALHFRKIYEKSHANRPLAFVGNAGLEAT
jgi:hypothetical protein